MSCHWKSYGCQSAFHRRLQSMSREGKTQSHTHTHTHTHTHILGINSEGFSRRGVSSLRRCLDICLLVFYTTCSSAYGENASALFALLLPCGFCRCQYHHADRSITNLAGDLACAPLYSSPGGCKEDPRLIRLSVVRLDMKITISSRL